MDAGAETETAGKVPDATDVARYRAMFDTEFSYVCRTLQRLGVRDADVEDAAQDTTSTAWIFLWTTKTLPVIRISRTRTEIHIELE